MGRRPARRNRDGVVDPVDGDGALDICTDRRGRVSRLRCCSRDAAQKRGEVGGPRVRVCRGSPLGGGVRSFGLYPGGRRENEQRGAHSFALAPRAASSSVLRCSCRLASSRSPETMRSRQSSSFRCSIAAFTTAAAQRLSSASARSSWRAGPSARSRRVRRCAACSSRSDAKVTRVPKCCAASDQAFSSRSASRRASATARAAVAALARAAFTASSPNPTSRSTRRNLALTTFLRLPRAMS